MNSKDKAEDCFAEPRNDICFIFNLKQLLRRLGRVAIKPTQTFFGFDGLSPKEDRKRWDRLHLMHLTVLMFLNNYGYDFQITSPEKLKRILTHPKKSSYLTNYFAFLKEYHLTDNKKIKELMKIAGGIKESTG